MRDVDAQNDIHQWERKAVVWLLGALVTCFTLWAGVVWNSGQDVVQEMRQTRLEDAQYRLLMERRLTVAEQQLVILQQRQQWVVNRMIDEHKDELPP
jgi:hypothetical protein